MPFKNPKQHTDYMRERHRKERGYKRGDRPQIFAAIPSDALALLDEEDKAIIVGYYRDMKSLAQIGQELGGKSRQDIAQKKARLETRLGIKKDSENT
ncbi:hypothetical protein [Gloeothece verrucosa]|uniref:hypothetical protein n=1 Tax=Gloeothece verrucosa TaxID=2546359 RepID=UPI0005A539E9|nr:hypothetical protein [Gloeothece verrucosa]